MRGYESQPTDKSSPMASLVYDSFIVTSPDYPLRVQILRKFRVVYRHLSANDEFTDPVFGQQWVPY